MPLSTIYHNGVRVMVFSATFNNISVISWQSDLLVEETGIPGENHYLYIITISEVFSCMLCKFEKKIVEC
jgi:hypothetical protein